MRARTAFVLLLLACRTAPGPPVAVAAEPIPRPAGPRFFAVGDTGTGGPDQYKVAHAIEEKCRAAGCDFGLLLGDNFYPDGVTSSDDPQWVSKFEQPFAGVLAMEVPFYAVLGNHDTADGTDPGRGAHQVAYAAGHAKWRMPARHYSFESGDATFVALDTQAIVSNDSSSTAAQRSLVKEALEGNAHPWVVGFGHHPYVSNGTNGNAGRLLSAFLEDRLCRAADLYLAGHDHNVQVLEPPPRSACRSLFVVAGGGGYETYALTGANPALFQARTLGFAYMAVEGNRLTVETYDADGRRLFATELSK